MKIKKIKYPIQMQFIQAHDIWQNDTYVAPFITHAKIPRKDTLTMRIFHLMETEFNTTYVHGLTRAIR